MISFDEYLAVLKKATKNLHSGKIWVEDSELFEEYLRQLDWAAAKIGDFLFLAKNDEQKASLLNAYGDFAKQYSRFLRFEQERKEGKVCQCGSRSKYACPRDPEFPCYFPT